MKDNILLEKLHNFTSIIELVQTFSSEEVCIKALEQVRRANGVISPYDNSSKVWKCKDGYYRCVNTGKEFNVKTGTLFENTKVKLQKWFFSYILNHFTQKVNIIITTIKKYTCNSKDSLVYATKD